MLLSKSKKFIDEYNDFKHKIENISDSKTKGELELLLKQLLKEVNSIDSYYQDLVTAPKFSTNTAGNKSNITNIRKKIFLKLEECRQIGILN
jgi:hypothetical protein